MYKDMYKATGSRIVECMDEIIWTLCWSRNHLNNYKAVLRYDLKELCLQQGIQVLIIIIIVIIIVIAI